jgi:hypothetical protein
MLYERASHLSARPFYLRGAFEAINFGGAAGFQVNSGWRPLSVDRVYPASHPVPACGLSWHPVRSILDAVSGLGILAVPVKVVPAA